MNEAQKRRMPPGPWASSATFTWRCFREGCPSRGRVQKGYGSHYPTIAIHDRIVHGITPTPRSNP